MDVREYGGFQESARALLPEHTGPLQYSIGYRHMVSDLHVCSRSVHLMRPYPARVLPTVAMKPTFCGVFLSVLVYLQLLVVV